MNDDLLLEQFIASFSRQDELWEHLPVPMELLHAHTKSGFEWRPCRQATSASALQEIYACTGRPFPDLYERLVLGWRWLEVTVMDVRLFANAPASDLSPLLGELTKDRYAFDMLVEAGLIPLGHGFDYDFVCFANDPSGADDGPLVRVEHEALLMHGLIEQQTMYGSFRAFVEKALEL